MAFVRRWLHVAVIGDEWTDRMVRALSAAAAGVVAWFLQPVDVTVAVGSSVLWSQQRLPLGTPLVALAIVAWLSYSAGAAWVTSRGPRLRVDDKLLVDMATQNHHAYFRLRIWNDGSGVASPEVRVVKVVFADGRPAANEAQLSLTLPWSSLGESAPRLTSNQKHGETVGVLGALWPPVTWGPVDTQVPPHLMDLKLYVPGMHHHLGIDCVRKVYVQVETVLPEYEHLPPIDRWFSIEHDEDATSGFRVAVEEPPTV